MARSKRRVSARRATVLGLALLSLALVPWASATCLARAGEPSAAVDLARLAPWTNPLSEHPYFRLVVERWKAAPKQNEGAAALAVEAVLKRSTDHPLSFGADWSGTVPLDELTLDASNLGAREVNVGVILLAEDGRRVISPFQRLPADESRVLEFSMLDAEPAQPPGKRLAVRRVEIAIKSLHRQVPYRVSLGTLGFHRRPQLEPVAIAPIEATGTAGGEVRLSWAAAEGRLLGQSIDAGVTVERRGYVFLKASTRAVESEGRVRLEPVLIELPREMPGGTFEVVADTRQMKIAGQPRRRAVIGRLTVDAAPRGDPVRARVEQFNGAPAIHFNGEPYHGLMYMTYDLEERYLRPFAEAGVDLMSFDTSVGFHPYGLTATSWPEPGVVDFSECDAQATRVLSACPEAKLLIRCYIACPPWWAKANADECMIAITPEGKQVEYEEKPGFRPGSWASQRWRGDLGEILRRFVRHLRGASYGDRVVGVMICAGVTEEWMMFGSNTGGLLTDYSEPAKAAFRAWARERYRSEARLQHAWSDPQATFATVRPPMPREIAAPGNGDFLDLPRQRRVADWWRFLSDLTAETIEHFAAIVKAESQGDWLCGAFYGYAVQFHEPRILTAGHLAIDRLVRSPHLDFFFSPALYSHRSLEPGGYSTFMSLTDTYHLHGKLWCNENDLRTFRVLDVPNVKADQIDRRQTPEETIALLRRQLGCVLARGCGHSYFDMGGGWYDEERLAAEIRAEVAAARKAFGLDRSSAAEVAVVIEPDAFTGQALFTQVNTWLILGQIASLGNMAAPFDLITLSDMPALPQRKLWIFLNLFNPTADEIEAIHRRLREDQAMGLFVYASGFQSGHDGMSRLTGMNVVSHADRRVVNLKVSKKLLSAERDVIYGTSSRVGPASFGECKISPTFFVQDDQAEVLGVDASSGLPGLCLKKMDGWTSVYSAAPCIAPSVLRALAKRAGVHLYLDEDAVVYANRSLVSVTVVRPGKRTIHLPEQATIEDAFTGEVLAREATRFDADFGERESRLFLLAP